ncbi:hypothetical protein BU25DRAFT_65885 [Macroventuria anomochaeta]|uniref:Uncharacterized protein n=1 Tax=Macroventuria anomochaeta TaxID=301207 RepID=A0ACB6S0J3_9PLEO|nr:uncharacterized protein BU25DRAFT_65885 [Macroventuria anomochaeta]KAF2627463.1 hypothetical protein BU25DRAFT_65885 [Macroventuria anomochaeta]
MLVEPTSSEGLCGNNRRRNRKRSGGGGCALTVKEGGQLNVMNTQGTTLHVCFISNTRTQHKVHTIQTFEQYLSNQYTFESNFFVTSCYFVTNA